MSEAIAFDTHQFIKHLTKNGFTEQQAEALANEQVNLLNGNLATKIDIALIHKDIAAIHNEIEGIRKEIAVLHNETAVLHKEIAVLRKEISVTGMYQVLVGYNYTFISYALSLFFSQDLSS